MRRALNRVRDGVRTQLWPVPVIGVVLALVAGIALPRLDQAVDDSIPDRLAAYLFGGGASSASTILDAIASSLITVTSLTFSLTVVTLQLASSQFSPRLLRTFMQDRMVHFTLALFLGTFTYALTVLRTVRSTLSDQQSFVPQISVTVGFVLAIGSVVGLVGFLAHLAREIRVETMIVNVHEGASATLRSVLRLRDDDDHDSPPHPTAPPGALPLPAGSSGFLTAIDRSALVKAATKADAVILLDRTPGASLTEGAPLGAAWPRHGGVLLTQQARTDLRACARDAVSTGAERTAAEDVAFGLRQLTDVANKALSPGVNDPTTAVHTLGHTASLLCELADYDLGPTLLRDDDGVVRVVLRVPTFAELVEIGIGQPRRYGASDPDVLTRIATLLRDLAWRVHPDQRGVVRVQISRLRRAIEVSAPDPDKAVVLEQVLHQAERALLDEWVPDSSLS